MPSAVDRLQRFVEAQAATYEAALAEIRQGRKMSHWMWFIFPQLMGLGSSPTARFYAIGSIEEARAYADHSILGPRLRTCAEAVAAWRGRTAYDIFGSPDDLKLRSSLTLFEVADPRTPAYAAALDAVCGGERDPETLRRLAGPR